MKIKTNQIIKFANFNWLLDFKHSLKRVCQKSQGGSFCTIGKFAKKRYIRYTLNPVWIIFVEGDSLALERQLPCSFANKIRAQSTEIPFFYAICELMRKKC